jgi:glycosyltransferase involved in cell wall biosynthesis
LVLLIIGDGAEYPYLVDKYSSIKEIVFVGAIEEENELAHYMRRVDFFIHTGLVGLNLVHGMCYGKPSIVLDLPIHSPEIEYLRNEKNGILVRTTAEMKLAIFRLLSDRDEVNLLGVNALADIKLHLIIQNMSNNFLKILS